MDLCEGTDCPKKYTCSRYRFEINKKKEDHFAIVPYNHDAGKCKFYLGIEENGLLEHVKRILNGDKNTE